MMIRPASFRLNEQTAVNNYYQKQNGIFGESANELALSEFDALVNLLRNNRIRVSVFDDMPYPEKPDCLFPNNWISFHEDDAVVLYPMFAVNRRLERRLDILHYLKPDGAIIDLSEWENQEKFLEGTGSLVLDRLNRVAYASLSLRTNKELLDLWAERLNYQIVEFRAFQNTDEGRMPIYHTNVVMSVCTELAVLCADCIYDQQERTRVLSSLENTGRQLILISEKQMNQFAGNMLEVRNEVNDIFFVMSDAAFHSLDSGQISLLEKAGSIIHAPLNCIETLGGGSARCMLAEVFND